MCSLSVSPRRRTMLITTCLTSSCLQVNLALLVLFPGRILPRASMPLQGVSQVPVPMPCAAATSACNLRCPVQGLFQPVPASRTVPRSFDKAQGHAYLRFIEVPRRGS